MGSVGSTSIILGAIVLSAVMRCAAAGGDDATFDTLMQPESWASCTYCHGERGDIHSPLVPAIAGQSAAYIRKQLDDFREGRRSDPQGMMRSAVALLDPAAEAEVAAYFARQPRAASGASSIATAEGGRQLFETAKAGSVACASCHGRSAAGAEEATPRLWGLHAGYIAEQLRRFRAGTRTNDPARVMRQSAQHLSDAEINALALYLDGR